MTWHCNHILLAPHSPNCQLPGNAIVSRNTLALCYIIMQVQLFGSNPASNSSTEGPLSQWDGCHIDQISMQQNQMHRKSDIRKVWLLWCLVT